MGLQFSLIEANLLGFFLVDVGNSRGKFNEIKEEFAINAAPIAFQMSLNARSRRSRDFPRNSLNSLHESIKSWKKRRDNTPVLKEILAQKCGPFDASSERIDGHDCAAIVVHRLERSWLPIFCWMGHDRSMIKRRSSHDRGSSLILIHHQMKILWWRSPRSCVRDESSVIRPMKIGRSLCLHASPDDR